MMLFGSDYASGGILLQVLIVNSLQIGLFYPIVPLIQSKGLVWFGVASNVLWAGTCLTLAWWLIPLFRGLGLASAFVASHAVVAVLTNIVLGRRYRVVFGGFPIYRVAALSLGSVCLIVGLQHLQGETWALIGALILCGIMIAVLAGLLRGSRRQFAECLTEGTEVGT